MALFRNHHGLYEIQHLNAAGELLWEDKAWNIITDEGENHILDVYCRAATFAGPFYVGLYSTGVAPVETSTLASLTASECTGGGYARQAVNRDATAAGWSLTGDTATAVTVTWTATDNWPAAISHAFLCTAANGTTGALISVAALSSTRTINKNDTLNVTYKLTQA